VNDFAGLEVWRGGVNSWECDEMGHLNVRFYVARAMEGLVGLAAALGLPEAFREKATATLLLKDHHMRFLREARAGTPLHMLAGVLEMDDSSARFLQVLIHSLTGDIAASFQTCVVHATAQDGRPFNWSRRTLAESERLRVELPARAALRSVDLGPPSGQASLALANEYDLIRLGAGAVGAADCDVFGQMRPDALIGRVSDGVPTLAAALRAGPTDALQPRPKGVGGAALEYRVSYQAWPRAGDRFEIRSGLAAVGDRTQKLVHWILDPNTGRAWATAEAISVSLDLDARKIIPISAEDRGRLSGKIRAGLRL
jgi:acyl-CoA thioester hydrolase